MAKGGVNIRQHSGRRSILASRHISRVIYTMYWGMDGFAMITGKGRTGIMLTTDFEGFIKGRSLHCVHTLQEER